MADSSRSSLTLSRTLSPLGRLPPREGGRAFEPKTYNLDSPPSQGLVRSTPLKKEASESPAERLTVKQGCLPEGALPPFPLQGGKGETITRSVPPLCKRNREEEGPTIPRKVRGVTFWSKGKVVQQPFLPVGTAHRLGKELGWVVDLSLLLEKAPPPFPPSTLRVHGGKVPAILSWQALPGRTPPLQKGKGVRKCEGPMRRTTVNCLS